MSEWERREKRERIERMARYIIKGISPSVVFEEFGDATRGELDTARKMASERK